MTPEEPSYINVPPNARPGAAPVGRLARSARWDLQVEFAALSGMPVVFDTSALSELQRGEVREQVCATVRERNLMAVVPISTIVECADTDREDVRVPRMEAVWDFLDALGPRGAVGADMYPSMRAEWAAPRGSAPLFPRENVAYLRAHTVAPGPRPAVCSQVIDKDFTAQLDARAARAFEERGLVASPANLDECMGAFRTNVLNPSPKSFALPFVTRKSSWARKQAARHPKLFPTTTMIAGLAQLHAWAALFARVGFGRWTKVLSAPRRGDWLDMRIASAAAYADLLISDDGVQRERVNFLKAQMGTRARAVSLIDWLFEP